MNFRAAIAVAFSACLLASAAIAATQTTNYGLNKPTIGADANNWGQFLNGDMDSLDSIVFGIQGTANAAMPKAGGTYTGKIGWAAAVAAYASANCPNGAAPTTPTTGDLWCVGGHPYYFDGTTTHTLAFLDSSITGNASTASKWATARTESLAGDVSGTSPAIDGSGNWSISTTLANSGVSPGTYGLTNGLTFPVITVDAKGRVTGATGQNIPAAGVGTYGTAQLVSNANAYNSSDSTDVETPAALASSNAYGWSCGSSCTATTIRVPGNIVYVAGVYDCGSSACYSGGNVTINFGGAFSSACLGAIATSSNPGNFSSPQYAMQTASGCSSTSVTFNAAGYESGGQHAIEGFSFIIFGR